MIHRPRNNPEKRSNNCDFACTKSWWKKTVCWPDCYKIKQWYDKSDKEHKFNSDEIKKIKTYFEISPIKDFKNYLLYLNQKIFTLISNEAEYNRMILDDKIKNIY